MNVATQVSAPRLHPDGARADSRRDLHARSLLHEHDSVRRLPGAHIDPPGGITALYYANPEWKEQWLGETIFYDEQRQPVHAVGVKPGRLALFHSDILHPAGVPSRECFEPRLSVVFTFVPR